MAQAAKSVLIKIPGTAVAFVGEATTETATVYQITSATKRVIEADCDVSVHLYDADDTAEASTDTTNIYMTGHGLSTGDLIINSSRSNTARIVTRVDDDHITVAAVTDQQSGDTIKKANIISSSDYTLNRLEGKVTYGSGGDTIYITGNYLPLSIVASSNSFELNMERNNEDATIFKTGGADFVIREALLLDLNGSLGGFMYDEAYYDYLVTNDDIVVFELTLDGTNIDAKWWGKLNTDNISAEVNGVVEESVEFEGVNDNDNRVISWLI